MAAVLYKSQAVIHREYGTQGVAVFGMHPNADENAASMFLTIPADQWADMGSPATVTVTVELGDSLNEDPTT